MNTIIQLNCRGFRNNFTDINILAHDFNPVAFCLQETYYKQTDNQILRPFDMYNYYAQGDERISGGTSLLIRQGTLHSVVPLQTNIQAVAVRLTLHVTLTLCSIYVPPSSSPSVIDFQALLDQLPQPFILVGDFNAHNPLWGSTNYNNRGKVLENVIADNNLCVFNDDSHTYLHPATGHYSALDLSICSPSLVDEFSWSVHSDLGGSDHFPTILETIAPTADPPPSRWKFSRAHWDQFDILCRTKIGDSIIQSEDPIKVFSDLIINISKETIPKASATFRIHKPWYNDTCKDAVKSRKKAERHFRKNPSPANLNSYRKVNAQTRRSIKTEKRQSWRNFIAKINNRTPISKVWNMVQRIKGKG
jgi:hypothetical protein